MEVKSRQVAQCKALRYTYLNICHLLQAVIGVTAYVIYRPMKDFGALVPELPETLDGILLWASVLLHQLAEPEEGCESKGHCNGLDSGVMGGAQEVTIIRRGRYRSVQSLACRPRRYFPEAPTSAICGEERTKLALKWHKYESP